MKRTICLLMALAMLASVLSGCGGKQEEAVQAAPKVENIAETAAEEVTEAPTTEPALSAEEVLYASLPEKVRYAVDLGIVELGSLDDLARICTGTEAAEMLQNARMLKRGEKSKILSQVKDSAHADIAVTRYWMAQMMHAAEMEVFITPESEDYLENLQYLIWDGYSELTEEGNAYFHQPLWIVSENYGVTSRTNTEKRTDFPNGRNRTQCLPMVFRPE